MAREIAFNAFVMNCVAHQSPGLSLTHWAELAKLLERGRFDAMFLADVLGAYDVYGDTPDAALRDGVQVPVNDPMMLVSAMALVTEHLGFGVTANLSYEPPAIFARRLSTLDHLTKGRIGWNIVTATRWRRSSWRSSTSFGRVAGPKTQSAATVPRACSPIPPRCARSGTMAGTTRWTRYTSPSRHRSARPCSSRPAPR